MITTTDAEHFHFVAYNTAMYVCMSQMREKGDNRKESKGELESAHLKALACVFKLCKQLLHFLAGNTVCHHGKTFPFNVIQLGLLNFNFKSVLPSS